MARTIEAEFRGRVISLHVYVGGHEVPLHEGSPGVWTGRSEQTLEGDFVRIELRFKAPPPTEWSVGMKIDGTAWLSRSGTTDSSRFSLVHFQQAP